jgi:hypothetical protein
MSREIIETSRKDIAEVEGFFTAFRLTMDRIPSDGGWTASQCLAHLADAEISLALRIRMMLTSERYSFANWDEDAFAAIKIDRDPQTSVAVFKSIRESNLEILAGLKGSDFERTGIRANGEAITLGDYVAMMSRHVRAHLEQAVKAAQG